MADRRRFFARSPDGGGIAGYETREAAEFVALEYGDGGPALVWAAAGGNAEIISLLLRHGADERARDGDGKGPADIALERGNHEIAALLKGWGGGG